VLAVIAVVIVFCLRRPRKAPATYYSPFPVENLKPENYYTSRGEAGLIYPDQATQQISSGNVRGDY